MNTLTDMTWEKWKSLSPAERAALQDKSDLCPELMGLEGCRVEATICGERIRFQVGKSTGWKPIHLQLHNAASRGGGYIPRDGVADVRIIRRA